MKILLHKFLVVCYLLALVFNARSQDVAVSLFYDQLTSSLTFHCTESEYSIIEDNQEVYRVRKGEILFINIEEDRIRISNEKGILGNFTTVLFKDVLMRGRFMLKSISPGSGQRLYNGDLKINVEHGVLSLLNNMEFDHYLAGVVIAEAGPGAPEEFLKAQAVLCRTYAIKNWDRHIEEGFNLCDDTHCQVFHGIAAENPIVKEAVLATHDIVISDGNYQLITAAYHSNSGGETLKADNLWPGEHEYLLPIIDPFSKDQPNYKWQEKLNIEVWKGYLMARGINLEKTTDKELLIQQVHRKKFFILGEDSLRISDIRADLGFKSAFFNMTISGDEIIIDGRGYGHGIGLSQEGGMEMARQGFSYSDILRYYYYDIQIRDLHELPRASVPAVFR